MPQCAIMPCSAACVPVWKSTAETLELCNVTLSYALIVPLQKSKGKPKKKHG
jgi:hypothetical protein